jgi:hypothetical protein
MSTLTTRLVPGAVIAVVILGLAACGANPPAADPGGIASIGDQGVTSTTTADGAATPDATEAPTDPNDAFVLYDTCMADHGFLTDAAGSAGGPTVSGGEVTVSGSDASDGSGPQVHAAGPSGIEIPPEDTEAFAAADEACRVHLANIVRGQELTPEEQAAMDDANLKMQQCMNDKGFNVQFSISGSGSGTAVETRKAAPDADQTPVSAPPDPAEFEAAMQECAKVFDDYPELADIPVPGRD